MRARGAKQEDFKLILACAQEMTASGLPIRRQSDVFAKLNMDSKQAYNAVAWGKFYAPQDYDEFIRLASRPIDQHQTEICIEPQALEIDASRLEDALSAEDESEEAEVTDLDVLTNVLSWLDLAQDKMKILAAAEAYCRN